MLEPTNPWQSNIGVPAMEPDGLGDEHEPVARPHLTAKPHVFHAAEGDEALFVDLGFMAEKARKLGGRLAHEHARARAGNRACGRGPRTRRPRRPCSR